MQKRTDTFCLKTECSELLFDCNGCLDTIQSREMNVHCGGLSIDAGVDGKYIRQRFEFQSFLDFNTWSLPEIRPSAATWKNGASEIWEIEQESETGLSGERCHGTLKLEQRWSIDCGEPRADIVLTNTGKKRMWINGIAFSLTLKGAYRFDFPGNVPYGVFDSATLAEYAPVETGLVTAVTHLESDEGGINLIFVDPEEKWGTGVFRSGDDTVWTAIAGTEMYLEPGQSCNCGSLYIQLTAQGDRFAPIREFYWKKGWRAPENGVKDAVVYSGHPSGPWDANFPFRKTMKEYSAYTDEIADMGFDTIWLLPLFHHTEPADPDRNVYTPTDQKWIDSRYGTDEDVRAYVDHAGALNIRVLFDYVPHGPRPQDELGKRYFDRWASKRQDGSAQEEWTCLSFDMANPEYLEYCQKLVEDHIDRFNIGGTRIDCAMGGLSNWQPYPGNRPSNSNLKGGVSMSSAMRRAFEHKGKSPFVTPENFHPIPLYASCTDAYYDMALYRVLFELNRAKLSRKQYVFELTRWLEHQMLTMPEGMHKLRFLGNHDTVSWVWDAKRAVDIYGTERAKAMWVLISLIDGCPMIYQGDEDPAICLKDGAPVLKDFFRDLFHAKKQYTSHEYSTEYVYTGTGLFAFRRVRGKDRKLVLINLDDTLQKYPADGNAVLLYGMAESNDGYVVLKPNEYCMLQY